MFPLPLPYAKIVGRKTIGGVVADGEARQAMWRGRAPWLRSENGAATTSTLRRRHMPYTAPRHSYINNVIPMHTARNLVALRAQGKVRRGGGSEQDAYAYTRDPGSSDAHMYPPVVSPGGLVCVSARTHVCVLLRTRLAFVTLLNSCFEVALRRAHVTRRELIGKDCFRRFHRTPLTRHAAAVCCNRNVSLRALEFEPLHKQVALI